MAEFGGLVVSWREGADLDEVVGEDTVSAPGSGSVEAGEFGAVPSVASLDVVDAALGSGSPFHLVAEGSAVFELAASRSGLAPPGDRHGAHSELVEVVFHRSFAVAAVGGDGPPAASGMGNDPADRGGELRGVGGIAALDGVIQHDASNTYSCSQPCRTSHPRQATTGTSKLVVSRRFVAAIENALAQLLAADLSEPDLVGLMIDGVPNYAIVETSLLRVTQPFRCRDWRNRDRTDGEESERVRIEAHIAHRLAFFIPPQFKRFHGTAWVLPTDDAPSRQRVP